jgi:O-antigen/teichoic acid export membrane protein
MFVSAAVRTARQLHKHRTHAVRLGRVLTAAAVMRAAQLAMVIIVARRLGPTDFGVFVFATGGALVAGTVGAMGWPLSFNRFFALHRREPDSGKLRGLMKVSGKAVLAGTLVSALAMCIAGIFEQSMRVGLIAGAIIAVPYGFMMLRRQQLMATRRPATAMLLDEGLASAVLLVAILVARLTLVEMLAVYFVAMVAGNVVATVLLLRLLPPELAGVAPEYELGRWIRSSLSLLLGQSARIVLSRLDVLLVPALAGLTQAGLYGAALRVTYILTFPQFLLQAITAPQFADAFAHGDERQARKILTLSIVFAVVTALPFVLVFVFAPRPVMEFVFGPRFAAGAGALSLIAIGQFAIGVGTPLGVVLSMCGREAAYGVFNLAVLAVSVLIALFAISDYGATGGGMVILISGVLLLVGQALLSLRPLGLSLRSANGQRT